MRIKVIVQADPYPGKDVNHNGLSEQQDLELMERHGLNELSDESYRTLPKIIINALREPTVLLLAGIGFLYILLGELEELYR